MANKKTNKMANVKIKANLFGTFCTKCNFLFQIILKKSFAFVIIFGTGVLNKKIEVEANKMANYLDYLFQIELLNGKGEQL